MYLYTELLFTFLDRNRHYHRNYINLREAILSYTIQTYKPLLEPLERFKVLVRCTYINEHRKTLNENGTHCVFDGTPQGIPAGMDPLRFIYHKGFNSLNLLVTAGFTGKNYDLVVTCPWILP